MPECYAHDADYRHFGAAAEGTKPMIQRTCAGQAMGPWHSGFP